MKKFVISSLFACCLALSACSSSGNSLVKNETNESVSQKVIDGTTTKDQVKSYYGDPQNIQFTSKNEEIWTYEFSKTHTPMFSSVPFQKISKTNKRTISIFFVNNIVEKHEFSTSNTEDREFHL